MKHFNVIIIGKGLVGSAIAKYLAESEQDIAIIGPNEPTDYNRATVFASHYDAARIQRIIGKTETWTRLNYEAANQYESIEEHSGIQFHKPVGCLYVNPYGEDEYLKNALTNSTIVNSTYTNYTFTHAIKKEFADFNFPETSNGLYEAAPAGLINPTQLLKAQLQIAQQKKVSIFSELVINVTTHQNTFLVQTQEGNIYTANKIVLATGSFLNYFNILQKPLIFTPKSEVVLLAQVSKKEAERLQNLPSLLYEINNAETESIYLIQPVLYPNGNYYIKIGCNLEGDIYFNDLQQIQDWFKNGDSEKFAPTLLKALKVILPNISILDYTTKRCIVSYTAHKQPYIGETVQQGLYVAGGCNGYSAMCSDAIGKVAAHLVKKNCIPEQYDNKEFELIYEN